MSALQISRAARLEVKELLAASFNTLLAAACHEFDIANQAFTVDYEAGANLFEGAYRVDDLRQYVGAHGPCQVLYTLNNTDEHGQTQCYFDGPVELHIDTHLRFPVAADSAAPPNTEPLCDAVEAAIARILGMPNAFIGAVSPAMQGSATFNRTEPERQVNDWFVSVLFSAQFHVTV